MNKYYLNLTSGLALLGTAVTASAQSSTITYYQYEGATFQSGGSSPYLGFNPTSGTYLLTDNSSDLNGYEASFIGNNEGGPAVSFYPTGDGTLSDPAVYAGTDGNSTHIQYFAAGSIIADNMALGGQSLARYAGHR